MTDTDWYPTGDPAVHLSAMLHNIDWRALRDGEPLHTALAGTIRESAQWLIAGLTDNPLAYGVGDTLDDMGLIEVGRATLLWLSDPTDDVLIDHLGAVCRACVALGDLLDEPPP